MSAVAPVRAGSVLHRGEVDASPPPSRDEERVRRVYSQVLLGVSLLVTWFLLYLFVLSGLEHGQAQSTLYGRLRAELAEGTAPTGAPIEPGSPVALLSIPAIDLEGLVVVEGSRAAQLQDGPGHVLGSVLPGQQGMSMIAGRSLSFGAPFARVTELPVGAPVTVTTAQGVFTYEVVGARSQGDPTLPAPVAGESRLTLVTASRGTGLGGLQPAATVFVDATLSEGAAAGPVAVRDTGVKLMSGRTDTTTLALLALSLQVLVGVLVGTAWAWVSWSRSAAWIAGAPCVLAALWLVSSVGSRLLPALI